MTAKGRIAIGAAKRAAPALGPRATLGALRSLASHLFHGCFQLFCVGDVMTS